MLLQIKPIFYMRLDHGLQPFKLQSFLEFLKPSQPAGLCAFHPYYAKKLSYNNIEAVAADMDGYGGLNDLDIFFDGRHELGVDGTVEIFHDFYMLRLSSSSNWISRCDIKSIFRELIKAYAEYHLQDFVYADVGPFVLRSHVSGRRDIAVTQDGSWVDTTSTDTHASKSILLRILDLLGVGYVSGDEVNRKHLIKMIIDSVLKSYPSDEWYDWAMK